jgi:hypothetical protein
MAEIGGTYMGRSLGDFAQACAVYIDAEYAKVAPDTDLIALLSDAVRLQRELMQALDARNQLTQWLIEARMEVRRLRATHCPTCPPAVAGT